MKTGSKRSFQTKPIHQTSGHAVRRPAAGFLRAARKSGQNLHAEYAQLFFREFMRVALSGYGTAAEKILGEPLPGGRLLIWIPSDNLHAKKPDGEVFSLNGTDLFNQTQAQSFILPILQKLDQSIAEINEPLYHDFLVRHERKWDFFCDRFLLGGVATTSLKEPKLKGFYLMVEIVESQGLPPAPIMREMLVDKVLAAATRTPKQMEQLYAQRRKVAPQEMATFRTRYDLPPVYCIVDPYTITLGEDPK